MGQENANEDLETNRSPSRGLLGTDPRPGVWRKAENARNPRQNSLSLEDSEERGAEAEEEEEGETVGWAYLDGLSYSYPESEGNGDGK